MYRWPRHLLTACGYALQCLRYSHHEDPSRGMQIKDTWKIDDSFVHVHQKHTGSGIMQKTRMNIRPQCAWSDPRSSFSWCICIPPCLGADAWQVQYLHTFTVTRQTASTQTPSAPLSLSHTTAECQYVRFSYQMAPQYVRVERHPWSSAAPSVPYSRKAESAS